jgi:hydroxymethylpyrimidine pyrophosphatase-like HAD family hydrolase
MKQFIFVDLDDTLFQTRRKCKDNQLLFPAANDQEGLPASFFTEKQFYLFNLLKQNCEIIPTTARNYQAFYRTELSKNFAYAILNHGGIILNRNGDIHQLWFEHIQNLVNQQLDELLALMNDLQSIIARHYSQLYIRLVNDCQLNFYILIKHVAKYTPALNELKVNIVEPYLVEKLPNFYYHFNDNNLTILPKFLNKYHAVKFIQTELAQQQPYISFGMGDSLTDLAYMQLCDYMITPNNSQINQHCFEIYTQPFSTIS